MAKKYHYIEIFEEDDIRLMTTIKDELFPDKYKGVKIARKFVLRKLLDEVDDFLKWKYQKSKRN